MAQDERVAQLEEENARLREQLVQRDEHIAALEARLADLEERVRRTPRNSSMPPSAEGFSKPPVPNRAQRRAEKRRQGKQPGDEGRHLAQVSDPTEIVTHEPVTCPDCGADLRAAEVAGVEVRQVFELEVHRHVTEHRMAALSRILSPLTGGGAMVSVGILRRPVRSGLAGQPYFVWSPLHVGIFLIGVPPFFLAP